MNCCEHPLFRLVEELGHAESIDWDLGKCANCGAYHLRTWSEYRPDALFYYRITDDHAQRFRSSEGRERIEMLKQFFAEN